MVKTYFNTRKSIRCEVVRFPLCWMGSLWLLRPTQLSLCWAGEGSLDDNRDMILCYVLNGLPLLNQLCFWCLNIAHTTRSITCYLFLVIKEILVTKSTMLMLLWYRLCLKQFRLITIHRRTLITGVAFKAYG